MGVRSGQSNEDDELTHTQKAVKRNPEVAKRLADKYDDAFGDFLEKVIDDVGV